MVAACLMLALMTGAANALEPAWVHANAAAQSEARVKAGFDARLKEQGKTDWNVSLLDSGGSGEATATNIQDAASRGVDAIVVTMADLAPAARRWMPPAPRRSQSCRDLGYTDGVLVDVTTNNWKMSADVSVYLLIRWAARGNLIFLRMAEHHGTRKRGDVMATVLKEYPDEGAGRTQHRLHRVL